MARNEEKQLARLNRFYLQKEKEATLLKNPPRPKLDSLTSAADIQKWLPSIKKDIDFCIKQSMVTCYPKNTVQKYCKRIEHLEREYKSFLRRLRELDPNLKETPWTDRPYAGQKRCSDIADFKDSTEDTDAKKSKCQFKPLLSPILDHEDRHRSVYGFVDAPPVVYNVDKEIEDKPLDFRHIDEDGQHNVFSSTPSEDESVDTCVKDMLEKYISQSINQLKANSLDVDDRNGQQRAKTECYECESDTTCVSVTNKPAKQQCSCDSTHVLKLPYSDSEDSCHSTDT